MPNASEVAQVEYNKRSHTTVDSVSPRVNTKGPVEPFTGLQSFDFGIPPNNYSWKVKGANRLLYNLREQDRFERLMVNGLLPDNLVEEKQAKIVDKLQDSTKFFTAMVNEFHEVAIDDREHPATQDQVPDPIDQKEVIVDRLKEQKEDLERLNRDRR